ncbi:uncharacterized protein EI97DRAFT_448390 [Westerdykella ornata]|uniref:SP-RING-type domain-containing protein n=1 Tax=Westerdykella ornata TaxID=318751 RepID=A0A6A6JTN4_WESOR|nr:uncharacterized protein EI97DRAFT_448390 [Westerdykella ornata]KAF2279727.1 hypothetical protein EI97DRAFT_448390 [Westerdykella ornata]
MSSRPRLSTARPTPSRPSRPSTTTTTLPSALPPYRKPSHPLTPEAQQKLAHIYSTKDAETLEKKTAQAIQLLTQLAGTINDALRERDARVQRRRKKWENGERAEEQEVEEEKLRVLREEVGRMTEGLERSVREAIDDGEAGRRIQEVLAWLKREAGVRMRREWEGRMSQVQTQTQMQTQGRQTQTQKRRRRDTDADMDDGEEEEEEDEGLTPGPTPLGQERVELTGLSDMYTDRMERKRLEYQSFSHQARYAQNNDYIGFKQVVHDATFGDDGPPLPRAETWFSERGAPAPGITAMGDGDDDDIVMDRATVSTRCPITFQQFKEPFSSKKCPHSFEKTAILQFIRRSETKVRGERAIQCPVSGCEQMLTANDLHEDLVLIRKIKRMQKAEAQDAEESESEEEDTAPRTRTQTRDFSTTETPMGDEPRASVSASQMPPPSSEVIDMGDPSDEDDEE